MRGHGHLVPYICKRTLDDGTKLILCRKCYNKKTKKPGRWFRADNSKSHKTKDHQTKSGNLSIADPSALLTEVDQQSHWATDDLAALEKTSQLTGIPLIELQKKLHSDDQKIASVNAVTSISAAKRPVEPSGALKL